MLDDRVREHDIEVAVLEGKRDPVALHEGDIGNVMFLCKKHPGVGEPVDDIQTDCKLGFFGEGDGHTTTAAASIENRPGSTNTGAFDLAQYLRASVVFEKGVVIVRPETNGAVFPDRVWLYFPQGWLLGSVR